MMKMPDIVILAVLFAGIGYLLPEITGISIANGQETEYVTVPTAPEKVEAPDTLGFQLSPYSILKPDQNIVPDKYVYDRVVQATTQDGHDVVALLNIYGDIDEQCLTDIEQEVAYVILESNSSDVAIRATDALETLDSESDRCEFTVQGISVFTTKE